MAEGLMRTLYPDRYVIFSAGTEPRGVNPHAVQVMAEIGLRARTFSVSGLNISPLPHFYGIDLKNPLAF